MQFVTYDERNGAAVHPSKQKAYYVGLHRYHYRAGEPAEILGVVIVIRGDTARPCYYIRFADGEEEYALVYDEDRSGVGPLHRIISEDDVKACRIPQVIF
jgi:hypothetical protein